LPLYCQTIRVVKTVAIHLGETARFSGGFRSALSSQISALPLQRTPGIKYGFGNPPMRRLDLEEDAAILAHKHGNHDRPARAEDDPDIMARNRRPISCLMRNLCPKCDPLRQP